MEIKTSSLEHFLLILHFSLNCSCESLTSSLHIEHKFNNLMRLLHHKWWKMDFKMCPWWSFFSYVLSGMVKSQSVSWPRAIGALTRFWPLLRGFSSSLFITCFSLIYLEPNPSSTPETKLDIHHILFTYLHDFMEPLYSVNSLSSFCGFSSCSVILGGTEREIDPHPEVCQYSCMSDGELLLKHAQSIPRWSS